MGAEMGGTDKKGQKNKIRYKTESMGGAELWY